MTNCAPSHNNIIAIFVTYNPETQFRQNVEIISAQVSAVIIVDNDSCSASKQTVTDTAIKHNCILIENSHNYGIAKALNLGIQRAIDLGCEWFITFDQDSIPASDIIFNLTSAYEAYDNKNELAIIASNYQELDTKKIAFTKNGFKYLMVDEAITSGTLMSKIAYQLTGRFREEFFIDLVDFEYCLRLRKLGYKLILAPQVGLLHVMGAFRIKKIIFIKIYIRDYSPLRNYYRVRNGIILCKEYLTTEPIWSIRRAAYLLIRTVSIIAFENNRRKKIKYILKGLMDAAANKMGMLSEDYSDRH